MWTIIIDPIILSTLSAECDEIVTLAGLESALDKSVLDTTQHKKGKKTQKERKQSIPSSSFSRTEKQDKNKRTGFENNRRS